MKNIAKINLKKVPKDKLKKCNEDEKGANKAKLNGIDLSEKEEEIQIKDVLLNYFEEG